MPLKIRVENFKNEIVTLCMDGYRQQFLILIGSMIGGGTSGGVTSGGVTSGRVL